MAQQLMEVKMDESSLARFMHHLGLERDYGHCTPTSLRWYGLSTKFRSRIQL
jgi:hypothetical protein